jgi:hypothetical protein
MYNPALHSSTLQSSFLRLQRAFTPTHGRRKIKHESTTRGIKHWGLSGYLNILPRIKFGITGQECSPQSPTISYRQRWLQGLRTLLR